MSSNVLMYIFNVLLGSIIILALIPREYFFLIRSVAMGGAIFACAGAYYIFSNFQYDNLQIQFLYRYKFLQIKSLGIDFLFGLDGISILFFLLTVFIIPLTLIYVWNDKDYKTYSIVLLLSELLLLLAFSTWNAILFYIFFELLIIPMFIMITNWGSRERKILASYLLAAFTVMGSILLLIALIYICNRAGTSDVIVLSHFKFTRVEQLFLWLAFGIAFACKIPVVPFHIWLPEAHGEAPTVGSVLLAGILLKLGVYGFIRYPIAMFPLASKECAWFLIAISAIGCLYSALCALRCTDAKKIIAYSSVSHMNLIVVGLFSNTVEGLEASILQCVSHGIVSSALFFLIGIIYDRFHTRDIYRFSYIFQIMPLYSVFFLFFTLSNMAIPGTANFIGEFLLISGAFKNSMLCAIVCASSVIFGAVYSLWICVRLLNKKDKPSSSFHLEADKINDISLSEFAILEILAVSAMYFGLNPNIFISIIHSSVYNIIAYSTLIYGSY
jgi:NADH-quinone oxidoreductase subunit M